MRKAQVVKHFGGQAATAKAFGVTRSAVAQWKEVVPERIAWKAQFMTGGALRVDPALYQRAPSDTAA
jgi:DNA-binding transcriptional regulator YdaS (Cro superfamily)